MCGHGPNFSPKLTKLMAGMELVAEKRRAAWALITPAVAMLLTLNLFPFVYALLYQRPLLDAGQTPTAALRRPVQLWGHVLR